MPWTYWILTVAGELDVATAPGLDTRITELVGSTPRNGLLLDLDAVTFVDCAGLGPLLHARQHLGTQLALRNPQRAVLRVLDLVGLAGRLQVLPPGTPWPVAGGPVDVRRRWHAL